MTSFKQKLSYNSIIVDLSILVKQIESYEQKAYRMWFRMKNTFCEQMTRKNE